MAYKIITTWDIATVYSDETGGSEAEPIDGVNFEDGYSDDESYRCPTANEIDFANPDRMWHDAANSEVYNSYKNNQLVLLDDVCYYFDDSENPDPNPPNPPTPPVVSTTGLIVYFNLQSTGDSTDEINQSILNNYNSFKNNLYQHISVVFGDYKSPLMVESTYKNGFRITDDITTLTGNTKTAFEYLKNNKLNKSEEVSLLNNDQFEAFGYNKVVYIIDYLQQYLSEDYNSVISEFFKLDDDYILRCTLVFNLIA